MSNCAIFWPKCLSLIERSGGALANDLRAIHRANTSVQNDLSAFDASPSAEGHLATTLQDGQQRALGDDRGTRLGIVQLFERGGSFGIGRAAFRGDGTLSDGGYANVGREGFTDAMGPAETIEASFGKHNGIVFAALHLAEASIHVAAQIANVQVRANVTKLSLAAQATGADASALPKGGESGTVAGNQAIANVFATANRRKGKARRRLRGDVFYAVNGDVDGFFQKSVFELLDKDALAADLRQRSALQLVTRSLDDDDLAFDAEGLRDLFADKLRLPFGKQTTACSDAQRPHFWSFPGRKSARRASTA